MLKTSENQKTVIKNYKSNDKLVENIYNMYVNINNHISKYFYTSKENIVSKNEKRIYSKTIIRWQNINAQHTYVKMFIC